MGKQLTINQLGESGWLVSMEHQLGCCATLNDAASWIGKIGDVAAFTMKRTPKRSWFCQLDNRQFFVAQIGCGWVSVETNSRDSTAKSFGSKIESVAWCYERSGTARTMIEHETPLFSDAEIKQAEDGFWTLSLLQNGRGYIGTFGDMEEAIEFFKTSMEAENVDLSHFICVCDFDDDESSLA